VVTIVGLLLPLESVAMRALDEVPVSDKLEHLAAYAVLALLPTLVRARDGGLRSVRDRACQSGAVGLGNCGAICRSASASLGCRSDVNQIGVSDHTGVAHVNAGCYPAAWVLAARTRPIPIPCSRSMSRMGHM
jgi:hypothetical protein